jgi:polyhydroxybutyrate depolymerase
MFLHGWGASGEAMLNLRDMVETARARGYAVIAPDGTPREGRDGRGWGFAPERPGPRDEIAFLKAARDDAIARHGIDAGRVVLGGFSIGGSMASYLACSEPGAFAAYLPVAGAFWHPLPLVEPSGIEPLTS